MWSLKDKNGNNIQPLKFSNGKNQEDIVDEISDKFYDGNNIIFLKANVGSGKSAIALNLINKLGNGILSTPTKVLQDQYQDSYLKKYHIGNLNISVMKGRSNFYCSFKDCKASNSKLPCIRKLKDKERRWNIASECPYWNPTFPKFLWNKISGGLLFPPESYNYEAIDGEFSYIKRSDEGCPYYNQYKLYTENNIAIIMNSQKWLIETLLGRKPKFDIEIIDEADLFLDQLSFNCKITHEILNYIELAERRKFKNIKKLHEMLNNKNANWNNFIKIFENILKSCVSEYAQSFLFKISLMRKCEEDINVNYSLIN